MHSIQDNEASVELNIGGDSYALPVPGDSGSGLESHDQVAVSVKVEDACFPLHTENVKVIYAIGKYKR
jgi:hypothetical protein